MYYLFPQEVLQNADLAGENLTGVTLSRANLLGANLTDTDLYGCRSVPREEDLLISIIIWD